LVHLKTHSKLLAMKKLLYIPFFLVITNLFAQTEEQIPQFELKEELKVIEPVINNYSESTEVYDFVQVAPKFPSGEFALKDFIKERLNCPELAIKKKIKDYAVISVIVEKDGTLSNLKLVKDPGYDCGLTFLEVVKQMPKWKPAEMNGKIVRCKYTMPGYFNCE
jgi:periplasmic protein TonB